MDSNPTYDKLRLELRRGVLVMAVLARLEAEHSGYSLRKRLNEDGIAIDEGTLYPLARRLEAQGLLSSQWREESSRKKRFYRLTGMGRDVLHRLSDEWRLLGSALEPLLPKE